MEALISLCSACFGSDSGKQQQKQQQQQYDAAPAQVIDSNTEWSREMDIQQPHHPAVSYAAAAGKQQHQHQQHQQQPFLVSGPPAAHPQMQTPPVVPPSPTSAELASLTVALDKLWALDFNRCNPGSDYNLNLQHNTFVSGSRDQASEPLFKTIDVNSLFATKQTFNAFVQLLPNFIAEDGIAEVMSQKRTNQQKQFIELVYSTPVMQYTHKYLIAKNLADHDPTRFKDQLYGIWFELYKRVVQNDTCAFEHTFAGEIRNNDVIGFHNWLTFVVEEKAGRADYRGYIKPKSGKSLPTGNEHVLSLQLSWKGDLKPVSSFLIGVSPEYELALYTLCFLVGKDGENVQLVIDGVECEVVVHRFTNHSGVKIGSAYVTILEDQGHGAFTSGIPIAELDTAITGSKDLSGVQKNCIQHLRIADSSELEKKYTVGRKLGQLCIHSS
ncbi:hypothetical protein HK100_012773 [Physocladia obscura]|uniref:EndoU domain-containing protein n=1 Tax=Physocladia obscura TaxID=109957 RepID=A0AAD5T579_9FUNG|nr:hypothetical protein HK100_012773 [Physocladia obscura]